MELSAHYQQLSFLLVKDDEGDYAILNHLLKTILGNRYTLTWKQSFDEGLTAIKQDKYDVYLIDYRLVLGLITVLI